MRRARLRPLGLRLARVLSCSLLGLGLCTSFCGCSSRDRSPSAAASSRGAVAAIVSAPAGSPSLPEDPVAGARSEAQWREHLAEEEKERKVAFDRRRLPQHRVVFSSLQDTRARYDRAQTPAAILKAEQAFRQANATMPERLEKLDRWGNSSNLLGDYRELLRIFGGPYPEARRRALAGSAAELDTVQREVDARTKKIKEWLDYVAKADELEGTETARRDRP